MSTFHNATPSTDWILEGSVASLIRYKALQLAHSPGFNRSEQPDIEQEFRLQLLKKASLFNPSRSKHITFAKRIILNKAASMAREVAARKRSYRRNSISLDETLVKADGNRRVLSEFIEESAVRNHTSQRCHQADEVTTLRMDVADAKQGLDPDLRIFAALLAHMSVYAAGQVLGVSRKKANQYLQALRHKFEMHGLSL